MKKGLLTVLLLSIFIKCLFSLTLIIIEKETVEIAGWVEEYHSLKKEYPKTIEDVLQKDFSCFGYNLSNYYDGLLKRGYRIFIENKTLVVLDSKNLDKCVYDFEKKIFLSYEGENLIDTFTIPYFTNLR